MTTLWTAAEAVEATGGRATGAWRASGVSIDTRSLLPGDLFVALKAERDGHDFVAQALAKGAAAAMVSRRPEGLAADAPLLMVDDVMAALEALGRAGRGRAAAQVIGVTGSVGKTSTKEMLRVVLGGQGRVHAAEKSFNNHWGVPLTLARLPRDADFAVIEIGMSNPGEIAPLARMARPHVAIVTTVAAAHMEAFGSLDGIAREKASIAEGLEPGGWAVLNSDAPGAAILREAAEKTGAGVTGFGSSPQAGLRLTELRILEEATVARVEVEGEPLVFKLATQGRHFALNGLAVLGAVRALELDLGLAVADLARWSPPAGRGTREKILLDPVETDQTLDLIDDAFNANPASMAAALEVLAATTPVNGRGRVGRGRRIAILGDMLELGPEELRLHAELADLPSIAQLDRVDCVGRRMRTLFDALPPALRGRWVETAAELAPEIRRLVDAGDVVLVKGSKGSLVSSVVDALRKLGHSHAVADRGDR